MNEGRSDKEKPTFRGDRMKELRIKRGFTTQQALATRIDVPQQQISRWETGEREPETDALYKLSQALNCSVDYLLGLTDSEWDEVQAAYRKGGWNAAGAIILERLAQELRKRGDVPRKHTL